jgi:prepilin-type N-terminal cleavage/methylation domain-containing protein
MIRNEKGVTLVEVLAALVLIGLAVTLFVSLSGTAALSSQTEDRRSAAMEIAENELNLWKGRLKAGEALPTVLPYIYPDTAYPGYSVRLLAPKILNASSDLSTLYDGQLAGLSRHVSMQTIVYRGGQPHLVTIVVSWEAGP